ncbi:MAG: Glutaredoxin [Desulfonauticus sp. 38_4375]|nr:MAG: Glutaredoxin [Desulfonauticus sp. 38_4375]
MPNKDIVLFALSTCIHCKNTKKFLDQKKVDYDCIYVDLLEGEEREKAIEEIKKYNPDLSFPTLVVLSNGKVVVGFQEDKIKEVLGC